MISSKAYIVAVAMMVWIIIIGTILAFFALFNLKILISLLLIGFLGIFMMVDRSYVRIPFMNRLRYFIYAGVVLFILMVIEKLMELINK